MIIFVLYLETSRLVPWLRQLDLPGQSYNILNAPRVRENFYGSKSKFLKAQVRKGLQPIKWQPWAYLLGTKDLGQD